MGSIHGRRLLVTSFVLGGAMLGWARGFPNGFGEAWGPLYQASRLHRPPPSRPSSDATATIRRWNQIAIDASGLDHTPIAPGEARVFGEQLGPGRSSRAMAIVHIAMFEAANGIVTRYESYTGLPHAAFGTPMKLAVAQGAHDALVALFASQAPAFDARLAEDLATMWDGRQKSLGIDFGRRSAAAILAVRDGDGSGRPEPYVGVDFIPRDEPGWWRQDPVSRNPLALGAHWGEVEPFVLRSPDQFRAPPPPVLDGAEYAAAFAEVKRVGGDGITTPTERTADQTLAGIFWAYDGTPSLCAPPRLYNQLTVAIATERRMSDPVELARLLALVNVAMADAGVAIWDSKYHYQFWRPVIGIREADPGTGPRGLGDGNDATVGDPTFMPLGAPASNLSGPNFTPPFPAYPSGHAGFGGALFQTLRRFYRTDAIPFTFVSDELNGVTVGNDGTVRPLLPRTFGSLSDAEEENGQSRIYLGIHWAFDKTEGIAQGRQVADWVFTHAFRPIGRADR